MIRKRRRNRNLLRDYTTRVVRAAGRPIRPRETTIIWAGWKLGWTPKSIAGMINAIIGPTYTLDNPKRRTP